jgi:hypothetical protein
VSDKQQRKTRSLMFQSSMKIRIAEGGLQVEFERVMKRDGGDDNELRDDIGVEDAGCGLIQWQTG